MANKNAAKQRLTKKNKKSPSDGKENEPPLQSIMINQRVLRKRPQKSATVKEELASDDSDSDKDYPKPTKKSNKSNKRKKVSSESDSTASTAVTFSDLKQNRSTRRSYVVPERSVVHENEECSASESENDMMDVFSGGQPDSNQETLTADENQLLDSSKQETTPSDTSNVGNVMEMLMACESATVNEDTKLNFKDSDSEDNWEQVESSCKPSPQKKPAKSKQRKRKTTENSDPDFETSSKKKAKKQDSLSEGSSRKRKKNTSTIEDSESKPKKVKKEQLTESEKEIRRFTNKCLKDRDSCFEQCSLVLGVAFLRNVARCSKKPLFHGLLLSLIPEKLHHAKKGLDQFVTSALDWYRDKFIMQPKEDKKDTVSSCSSKLMQLIVLSETSHEYVYVAGFFTLLQVLGIETRFVGSLYVPSLEKVATSTKLSSKTYPNPSYWVEIKDKEKLIAVDVINGVMTEDAFVESKYVNPQGYVVSITTELAILDSTPKYVEKWSEIHRKARMLNFEFWDNFIADQPRHWVTLKEHSSLMKQIMVNRGFPKSLGGFKHNLVFALEKDNLKIEAIYPKDAPVLGTFKTHNVYSRDNIKSLKQIIVIKKEGRALKEGEVPYKIVKQKILFDRWPGDDRWKDLPLYGDWQTEWYKAPTAENGVVPRNEFGNVELFKPWMLPKNSVHLDLPGSYALARRLNIDAPHAVVGFEFPRCRAVPVMSGVVVCKEYAETLRNAWVEYNAIQTQKAEVSFLGILFFFNFVGEVLFWLNIVYYIVRC